MARLNPYRLSLSGRHLIEASAGTGKTFNAVILWIRASIELDLAPHQVLMVTFTRAATAELRERLKLRIEELLTHQAQGQEDPLLEHFLSLGTSAEALRHALILRLQTLDDAAVTTLHGWAGQAIREFDQLLNFEVADELPGLRARALEDAWQATEQALGEQATLLSRIQGNPEKTLESLGSLFNYKARKLTPTETFEQAMASFDQALDAVRGLEFPNRGAPPKSERDAIMGGIQARDPAQISRVKTAKFEPAFLDLIQAARVVVGVVQRLLFQRWSDQFEMLKRTTGQVEADDQVLQLKQACSDPAFAQALAQRWPVALVDEFQDTDPDQLAILQQVYDAAGCLMMIGDPKQALYSFRGGDIAAYQRARRWVDADNIHSIDQCFRMSKAMVQALNDAYQQQPDPFSGATHYHRIDAGKDAGSLQHNGQEMAPVQWLAGEHPIQASADACAHLLQARVLKPDGTPLVPGDMAILVNAWSDGIELRKALAGYGIGARVRANHARDSEGFTGFMRFAHACAHPRDSVLGRALVPCLISGIAPKRWAADPKLALALMQRIQKAAALWEHKGAIAAARAFIYSGPDFDALQGSDQGLACIAEFLDLAEQCAHRSATDTLGWCTRPARQKTYAPIPSDDAAVIITTIHSSKGLEYPVVILPKAPKPKKPSIRIHSDGRYTQIDLAPDDAQREAALRDAWAESQRLLYVAATRAQHLLLMHRTPKCLLGIEWPESCAPSFVPQPRATHLQPPTLPDLPPGYDGRALSDNWRVHSFSGWIAGLDLAHSARGDHDLEGAAGDYPKGPQAGDVLHRLLDWRLQGLLSIERATPLLNALEVADIPATLDWIEQIVQAPIVPSGHAIADCANLPEMDFHFALGAVDGRAFDQAVQRHWSLPPRNALPADYLHGLMKGSLDVTLRADGRYWVLDYKSNYLGQAQDYTAQAMDSQIAQHRYDVQAAIYLVALHRLLKQRLADYQPQQHLGGAIYQFVRVPSACRIWSITPQAILELEALLCPPT
ncbi:MAG: UvrD-helicase domain-containing protein [Litorivicinus sp.]